MRHISVSSDPVPTTDQISRTPTELPVGAWIDNHISTQYLPGLDARLVTLHTKAAAHETKYTGMLNEFDQD